MIIAVGTSNPIKVRAVKNVFSKFFRVTVVMKQVPSKAPPQPVGLDSTIEGAISRARGALDAEPAAELGVGIEAGIISIPRTLSGYMDQQFAAIVDRSGRVTLGGGPSFEYPRFLVKRVLDERIEVNNIMAELTGEPFLGHKEGAIGYFSKGTMNRTALTELAVLMALIPRLNEDLYFGKP
ncbi:MAG: inosine/xanthosine triphosphatase [Candidatus Methanomethyliaceae archaeon]|nr:inosine/xanthosine triphosphatase [Candidatus Methanomethyliaceae archaeon]